MQGGIMAAVVERTPRRITVSISPLRWQRILQLEKADRQARAMNHTHYRHEALCGIFRTDATERELVEDYLSEKYQF